MRRPRLGRFPLSRISSAVERFLDPWAAALARQARLRAERVAAQRTARAPLRRQRCERPIITDPLQVFGILHHLIKTGAAPPGLEPASVS